MRGRAAKMSPRPPPASHEPSQHTSLRSRFSGRAAAVEPAIDCSEARDIQEFRARVFVIRARKVGERSVRPNRHARKHAINQLRRDSRRFLEARRTGG